MLTGCGRKTASLLAFRGLFAIERELGSESVKQIPGSDLYRDTDIAYFDASWANLTAQQKFNRLIRVYLDDPGAEGFTGYQRFRLHFLDQKADYSRIRIPSYDGWFVAHWLQ